MADTQRTRSALLSLMADNVTGQISAQDFRDFMVTVMESEFANPGDFWAGPQSKFTTTNETARGWKEHSQYMGSDCSWMNIMYQDPSTGYWMRANVSDSLETGRLGVAMDSYASDVSTAIILIQGVIQDATFSTLFSRLIGRPIYLDSGVPGSISLGETGNSVLQIGYIVQSEIGDSVTKQWYFMGPACWAVKGQ